jgi:hypothetical protein
MYVARTSSIGSLAARSVQRPSSIFASIALVALGMRPTVWGESRRGVIRRWNIGWNLLEPALTARTVVICEGTHDDAVLTALAERLDREHGVALLSAYR